MKKKKKYIKPSIEIIKIDAEEGPVLLAGSAHGVRNDDEKIMEGSPDYDNLDEGDGSDAAAKKHVFTDLWDD